MSATAMSPDSKKRKTAPSIPTHPNGTDMPHKDEPYTYHIGFGNSFESEALKGAVPRGMNNPKVCPYGLYAEQLSGTSFTTPNAKNKKVWFYRIRPSVVHEPYKPINAAWTQDFISDFTKDDLVITPQQLRWKPFPMPAASSKVTFIEGIKTIGGSGSPETKTGFSVHVYTCNTPMGDSAFNNADADMLIVPQQGSLFIRTECGRLFVPPGHICVIQRGQKFAVDVTEPSRGYISEIFKGHFVVPDRGPVGANGNANERDFEVPVAWYDDAEKKSFTIIHKFCGKFFTTTQKHSCFDVVGWHGNYVPYRYDLNKYCAMNSVTYDHPDPSIFTVLTAQTDEPGVAVLDFVIFPQRWQVQWNSFRIPYYHRNCMTEYMGNIFGSYEAKPGGFAPGAGSLHSCMAAHGPDADAFKMCTEKSDAPELLPEGISFMFESTYIMRLTKKAMADDVIDKEYWKCWQGLGSHFSA